MIHKRIITCLALVLFLLFGALPVSATETAATSGAIGNSASWSFRDGTLTISGSGDLPDISFLNTAPWAHLKESITAVEIGDGITRIGDDFFGSYGSIQRVTIGNSVQSIGERAFLSCTSLQEITIPASMRIIEGSAFSNCTGLTTLILENGVTSIGSSAFKSCVSLKTVTLPNSLATLGGYAFYECTAIESVSCGTGLTTIGSHAFYGCSAMKTVAFSENLKTISDYAFYNCGSLTNFTLPGKLNSIGKWAFNYCYSLTELTIPASVSTIGDYAFTNCSGITSLTIQNGVQSIGAGAFKNDVKLKNVVIPDSVTFLGNQAFYACQSLEKVTIGNGLTAIGSYAFQDCTSLKTVEMGNNVTTLGTEAFHGCTALTTINLSENLETIGNYAFWNCTSLKRIKLHDNLKTIGQFAFSDCISLKNVTIPGNVETVGNNAFTDCTGLESVVIEEGVVSIGNGAFKNCTSLGKDLNPDSPLINNNWVEIPDSVTYLGNQVFYGCTLLEEVYFGENIGITEIGSYAFRDCESLKSILIPDSVATIGTTAFSGCDALTFVSFGKGVQKIGGTAFLNCGNLHSLWFAGDAPEFDKNAFLTVNAKAQYYAGNTTWTEDKLQDYGGNIVWIANWSESFISDLSVSELREHNINITPYDRTGDSGIGRRLYEVMMHSAGGTKEIIVSEEIARNEAKQSGVSLTREGYREYVIPGTVAESFHGANGKAFEFTALMTKDPWIGKNKPYISTVFGRNHGTGEAYVELRSNRLVLSPYISQDVVITARGFQAQDLVYTISGSSSDHYYLMNKTGVFSAESLHTLAGKGNVIYVWVESATTGETTDKLPIYVTKAATNTDLEKKLESGEISLLGEDGLKIKLGGNSELFEGLEFDLADFEIPVGFHISNNKLKVSLGIDIYDSADTEEDAETNWNLLKGAVDGWNDRRKKAGEAVDSFRQWQDEMKALGQKVGKLNYIPWQSTISKDFDFNVGAMGYAEYQYTNGQWVMVDGALGIDGEFKLAHKVQTFVGPGIPVFGAIKGGAGFQGSGSAIRSIPDSYCPFHYDVALELTPEISIHGGLGIVDCATGGLYGSGSLPINMAFSNGHLTIAAKGEIGAEAEFLGQEFTKTLLESNEIMLVDRYLGSSMYTLARNGGAEQTVTAKMSRTNAQNTSGDVQTFAAGSADAAAKGVAFRNLQTGILSNAQPQLVTVGDRMLLVWAEDCAERDSFNRMRVVYAVYEPGSNSWSAPAPVWDNGCNEGYARLVSDGQNAWILWQKAKTVLTGENAADFAFIQVNMELCLARFDAASGTFADPQMITDNSIYEYAHHIYLDNGIPRVLWASVADNVLGDAGKHSITCWHDGSAEVLADSLNYVLSINGAGEEITYVSDKDGNLSTTGDITAFTMSESGTTAYNNSKSGSAATYAAYATLGGEKTLFVSDMLNIYYRLNGQWKSVFAETRVMDGNIQIEETSQGTTILWTESGEGGNALYSVQFRGGSWSEPVQISGGGQILSNLSAVCYDGKLTGVCNANAVSLDSSTGTYTKGETDLVFFQTNAFTDIALNYVLPLDESELERNADAVLQVSVTNQGTTDADQITFTLSDTLGTEVEQTVAADLASGETKTIALTYPVPGNYAATTITITAKTNDADADPADNVITLDMGKPDLAITDSTLEILDDAYMIKVIVENRSLVDAENVTLEVRMENEESAPVLTKDFSITGRDHYAVIDVIIPSQLFDFDQTGLAYVYMTLNTNGSDSSESDNTVMIPVEELIIERERIPSGMKGDLNLDNAVNSDDLTLLARHVGGIELVEDAQALSNCDVNGDGQINSDDLTKHARYVGGIITDWDDE